MLWQLAQMQFCDDKHLLWRDGETIQLEPKPAEVLAYFCRHPGRLISRDEFIAEVWQGQIVTDNAINRIIAKLRKSLGDSAKQSELIITLPRKGYRFIAPVSQAVPPLADSIFNQAVLSESSDIQARTQAQLQSVASVHSRFQTNKTISHQRSGWWVLWVSLILLAVIGWGGSLWQQQINRIQKPAGFKLTPLTRESGEELMPALAPNGRSLIYSAYQGRWLALYLKDLQSSEISLLSNEPGHSGNGAWSRDGRQFVYFYHNAQTCALKLIELSPENQTHFPQPIIDHLASGQPKIAQLNMSQLVMVQPKVVHLCPIGSFGNVSFSHDGTTLIYSESQGQGTAYQLYLKNLTTGEIKKPAQPPLFLAGNAEFDLHPTQDQLLIASPDKAQQLAYYLLDLPSNTLRHLFNKKDWLCCPIWDQQGRTVLQADASPSNQLLQFGLDGKALPTLFSTGHGIDKLRRAGDGVSYVYSGWTAGREIHYQTRHGAPASKLISSSVSDSMPRIAHQQPQLAFVSERSGSREIWLHQIDSGKNSKLSHFNRNDWVYDVQWSPDDSQLAVLLSSEIQLLNIATGKSRPVKLPPQEVRGLSWVNQQTLAFSLLHQQQWRLYHYDLTTEQLQLQPGEWAYASYDAMTGEVIHINQQQQLFLAEQLLPLELPAFVERNRRFYFSFLAGRLYYLQKALPGKLQKLFSTPSDVSLPQGSDQQLPAQTQQSAEVKATMGFDLIQYDIATASGKTIQRLTADTIFSIGHHGVYFTVDKAPEADIFLLNPLQ
ncbi:MAG: winged helix-turn-helix domain-containing protein [Gammaproteobacteria bacterium]|nr:winged helix-turn-helix domain-containing protein [Gammaproteobacteria bacterium]MBU2180104.1 winged helix-turn-helix domain-containing protein [Gammaproteobacteria bacterium]